jgi:hypothetical protein
MIVYINCTNNTNNYTIFKKTNNDNNKWMDGSIRLGWTDGRTDRHTYVVQITKLLVLFYSACYCSFYLG